MPRVIIGIMALAIIGGLVLFEDAPAMEAQRIG